MKNEIETLEKIQTIINFAKDIDAKFNIHGECGFGRPCIGITKNDNWIAFNPLDKTKGYEPIKELFSEKFYDIKPEDAYHKFDCLAVLLHDDLERAIDQLYDWVRKIKLLGVEAVPYAKAQNLAFEIMGIRNPIEEDIYALKIKKQIKGKKKTK